MPPKKVAIVGSGCSGLAALWALKSTKHDVHLFESSDRLGGHTNTVAFQHKDKSVDVDTGFIVMNSATYPNFIAFLKHTNVEPVPTDMTFGVSRDHGHFEWSGTSLSSIFAQRKNLFSMRMWIMILDVVRFNLFALDLLAYDEESEDDPIAGQAYAEKPWRPNRQQTVGEYLDRERYSVGFRDDYLIPMTASIWSTSPDKTSLEFPIITLVRFMWNHHLLSTVAARPTWMTIPGGSRRYINEITKEVSSEKIHLKMPVVSAKSSKDGSVNLLFADGSSECFDHVILATHGDTAASIIRDGASEEEIRIFSGFKTSRNTAILHSDLSLMPEKRLTWSSWNYITTSPSPTVKPSVCLTYCMNILQHIPYKSFGEVLVTLNPLHRPAEDTIQGEWVYHHPLYNADAIKSQKLLPKIQNTRGLSYVGAWTKYGFHEDGFSSGLKAAAGHLDAKLPFEFVDSTFSRGRKPQIGLADHIVRLVVLLLWNALSLLTMVLDLASQLSRGSIKLS